MMMNRISNRCLVAMVVLCFGASAFAQSGPTAGGETGLFTVVTGETLPAQQWSAGWYVNNFDRPAGDIPAVGPFRGYEALAYDRTEMSFSLAYGVTDHFELAMSLPYVILKEHSDHSQGTINGIPVRNVVDEKDRGPIHLGGKFGIWTSEDSMLRLGVHGGVYAPTRHRNDENLVQTGEWDYNTGLAFTARYITFDVNYVRRGNRRDIKIPDEIHGALGVEVPATQNLDVIWEVSHIKYRNNCDPNPLCREIASQTDTTLGMRYFINDAVALNAGVRLNMTEAFGRRDNGHGPVGWVAGITYFPRKKSSDTTVEALPGGGTGKGTKKLPPPPPVITVPANNSTVATSTPAISGTSEPNALVKASIDGGASIDVRANAGGAWSTTSTPLADGPHTVSATQTNSDNLTSEPCPTVHFTVAKPVEVVKPTIPEKKPDTVTNDKVEFQSNSSRLSNIAKAVLDQVALRMKSEGGAKALVLGYTDGSEKKDMKLSGARAEACRDYLVKRHGIDAGRISIEAKGKNDPAGDNKTKTGRQENRRAVIRVTIAG